jgi:hypothetical protein
LGIGKRRASSRLLAAKSLTALLFVIVKLASGRSPILAIRDIGGGLLFTVTG